MVILANNGCEIDRVDLPDCIAVGDSIQTKKGRATVQDIQWGTGLVYVTVTF